MNPNNPEGNPGFILGRIARKRQHRQNYCHGNKRCSFTNTLPGAFHGSSPGCHFGPTLSNNDKRGPERRVREVRLVLAIHQCEHR